MATFVQLNPRAGAEVARPVRCLQLWHLLSLDAPTVAVVWTAAFGRARGSVVGVETLAAMFCAVWMIYAGDRLLDARKCFQLEARHWFHERHHRGFLAGIAVGLIALMVLVPAIPIAQLRLNLILAAALGMWMLAIHMIRRPLPKEWMVGPFFATAVVIPSAEAGHVLVGAVLLAGLCTLNCLFIRAWEGGAGMPSYVAPTYATVALVLVAAAVPGLRAVTSAIALSGGLLLVLDWQRRQFAPTTLRALADLVLLTPLLLGFWRG